jgi:predicted RND superfamily exporter protein
LGLIFIPAVLSLAPLSKKKTNEEYLTSKLLDKLLEYIISTNRKKSRLLLSFIAIIIILISAGIFFIKVESNPISYFKPETPISINFNDINKNLSGSLLINVLLEGNSKDFFEKPNNIEVIANIQKSVEQLPGIDKSLSFADYLKLINYVQNKFDSQKYIVHSAPLKRAFWAIFLIRLWCSKYCRSNS